MTAQASASLLSSLQRAREELQPPPFTHLEAAVRHICELCAGVPEAEVLRGPFAMIALHPPPTESRAQANLAALEFAARWLSEARSLAETSLTARSDRRGEVIAGIDILTHHIERERARHSATIDRLRVAAELRTLADDTARWLSMLPGHSWSTRLHAAAEFLEMGYVARIPDANDRNEINGEVSATERHLLETLRSALERLLAPVPYVASSHYEDLVRRHITRPSVDDAMLAQVIGGLAWLLRAVQGVLEPKAQAPGTAPTQPAPADDASPDPNAEALASLCKARDYAYEALQLNLDPEVFSPDLAGAIEHARSEIATALRMIAPEGATDLDTPRAVPSFDAPTPSWALLRAYAALFTAAPADNTPARTAVHRATAAVRDASIEAGRSENVTRVAPQPGDGLTHNQRVTLERGLRALTKAHAYACDARNFGEDDQSPDGAALEQVCVEVWAARELVRGLLKAERQHLADGWDNEHVLRRETTSATRALVVLHETLTEWLDDADPRRRSFPHEVPDDVLKAVRGALLSVDRVIVARTAYPAATTARRFLGGVLTRLARWVRP